MATHSSILAWRIPWTEEPKRLQHMGVRHSLVTESACSQPGWKGQGSLYQLSAGKKSFK